ncbi:MAG: protein-L-isoaspartate(D-aspartate) O-methyltransferase [Candidatus Thorarchaeota archaeon]|nr:protein-L-isoaspartate(D-aspartate) O-methyltransferase [Candidatus Thorarchaeota archaeon]MCK5239134.1 protein-L-isoaspartate(D-aspartate) O-methyltransferase [Candidatus Thorarchaeota archaeon]
MLGDRLEKDRENLVERLRARGYLSSKQVEQALRTVPREEFVLPEDRKRAYRDSPLSIAHGQTISAPHMCVIMCEGLKLSEGMSILEVGAGSGYHAALCAELVARSGTTTPGHVYTIEIVEKLIDFARGNLERAGYSDRVTLIHSDGGKGLPEHAPFDRILVAAAAPSVPKPLVEQLAPGGIMLIPVGSAGFYQELMMVEKSQDGQVLQKRWGGVAFVPLTGKYGY